MTQRRKPPETAGDLFAGIDPDGPAEVVTALLERPHLRLERIVSTGQVSPPGFWYDQPDDEWVLLVSGAARIAIEDGDEIRLGPGSFLLLPAHCRHRVTWTDPDSPTVWLALRVSPNAIARSGT